MLSVVAVVLALTGCRPMLVALGATGSGPDCVHPEVDLSGQTLGTNGWIHSNGDIAVSGTDGNLKGLVSAVGEVEVDPGVVLAEGNPIAVEDPIGWEPIDIALYRPGGAVADLAASQGAYYDFSGADLDDGALAAAGLAHMPPGIYYTDGDILLDTWVRSAALVAEGRIETSSVSTYWEGDPNRVLALSNHDGGCGDAGIRLFAGMHSFLGRLVAPNSGVQVLSPLDQCAYISASTEIVATWMEISGREVYLSALPAPEDEKFLTVGCAIGPWP